MARFSEAKINFLQAVPSFDFSFHQTAAARKNAPIPLKLQALMKRAAKLVGSQEIENLTNFSISIVAMSDDELLALNISALGHDFLTDVITFEIERSKDGKNLEAEIYISVERAKDNALRFKQTFNAEITRLIIHGVLHLAGYTDKSPKAKKRMRNRERYYLAEIFA